MTFAKLKLFERTARAAQPVFHFPVRVMYSGALRTRIRRSRDQFGLRIGNPNSLLSRK